MRRDQLEHAIGTACQIIEHPAVVVVGSQSILGTYTEDELPPQAAMSVEIDILPLTRLIEVQNANTAAPAGRPRYTGWCLDKSDLCVAKLCALREKDQNFVAALLDAVVRIPLGAPYHCRSEALNVHRTWVILLLIA